MNDRKQRTDKIKPTRYYSKKQEDAVAKKFQGNRTLNSGATMFDKSDVKLENFAIECKTRTTASSSISIKKEWLEKTSKEALFNGKKYSALSFSFGPGEPNYYVIDEELFQRLVQIET